MPDGAIVFSTALDNKTLEKQLSSLTKKIDTLNNKISQKETERAPLIAQAEELQTKIQAATLEVERYKQEWASGVLGADTNEMNAREQVAQLRTEYDGVLSKVEKYDVAIGAAALELDRNRERAGAVAQELNAASGAAGMMGPALNQVGGYLDRILTRVKRLAARVLFFSVIMIALRSLRKWFGNVIKTNDQATAAIARLKGALLTLAQPLLDVIVPAFIAFVNILTRVVSAMAQLFALLMGTTIDNSKSAAKALNAETEALEGTGKAAKDAGKSMAGFDEINQLSGANASGAGSAQSEIKPDFSFKTDFDEGQLSRILELVQLIGSAFLAWKIGSALMLNLKQMAGLALAIYAAVELVKDLMDVWNNGATLDNVQKIFLDVMLLTAGLALAFGAVGAGIGLAVSGIAMIVTGFKDVIENGASLENTLLIIGGIIATGLGIALLTNSAIPALVAGIRGIIVAIVAWQGNLEELAENLKLIFGGIIDFIKGVFTGDWGLAWEGVKKIFKGIWNSIVIIVESAINGMLDGINWLIKQLNKIHFELPEWVPGVGGKSFGIDIKLAKHIEIPRLALGAVIPPNREFLATLGDQKSGNNIETPEALLRKIVREEGGGDLYITSVAELDGEVVYRNQRKIARRYGTT